MQVRLQERGEFVPTMSYWILSYQWQISGRYLDLPHEVAICDLCCNSEMKQLYLNNVCYTYRTLHVRFPQTDDLAPGYTAVMQHLWYHTIPYHTSSSSTMNTNLT